MKKTILVTGGTGFIGSHTVVELQAKEYQVVIVDNLSNSDASVVDKIESITGIRPIFEEFDLADAGKTNALFKKYDIESIIHFAASKAVGESVQQPLLYYHNNLVSLMNLLSAMKEYGTKNMVFSSSCTVYGEPDKLPVTEETPTKPAESPYGNTKQICEEILQDVVKANSGDINIIALRYFNPIGAHPSAKIGELPLGIPANLVPFITQTAAGIREKLSVFGDDYNTPDGSAIRDYINVVDLAKAHVISIERMEGSKQKEPYEVFNIGTGKGTSVLELVNTFEKVTGIKLNYQIVDRREGDIEQIYADTSYANKELGWRAETSVEETMKSAWEWEKKVRNIQ